MWKVDYVIAKHNWKRAHKVNLANRKKPFLEKEGFALNAQKYWLWSASLKRQHTIFLVNSNTCF